jgi:hypothetical protein
MSKWYNNKKTDFSSCEIKIVLADTRMKNFWLDSKPLHTKYNSLSGKNISLRY